MATKGERTKERVLETAIRLFSENGFQGTSIRTIAKELGMNEASLYNHFAGKEDLYNTTLDRFSKRLLVSGIKEPDRRAMDPSKSLFELLREDAERFFEKTRNEEATRMWRILMMEQYRHRETGEFIRRAVRTIPKEHLFRLLEELQALGKVRRGVPLESVAHTLSAIFFDYSFGASLQYFWEGSAEGQWEELIQELQSISTFLEA